MQTDGEAGDGVMACKAWTMMKEDDEDVNDGDDSNVDMQGSDNKQDDDMQGWDDKYADGNNKQWATMCRAWAMLMEDNESGKQQR